MKTLLLACAIVLVAQPVLATPGGLIGVYSDQAGTNCGYSPVFGVSSVYVVHTGFAGATSSRFKVDFSGVVDPFISETSTIPILCISGDCTGLYGGCLAPPVLVVTLSFFDQNLTPACTPVTVVPRPDSQSGTIEVVDCNDVTLIGSGGVLWWNGGEDTCEPCITTPTEEQSWGRIKAFYQ